MVGMALLADETREESEKQIVPVTGEELIEIFNSPEFLSNLRSARDSPHPDNRFRVYRAPHGGYFVSELIKGGLEEPGDPTDTKKIRLKSFTIVDVRYHDSTRPPLLYGSDGDEEGYLERLNKERFLTQDVYELGARTGLDTRTIGCILECTQENNLVGLLIQESGDPIDPDCLREKLDRYVDGHEGFVEGYGPVVEEGVIVDDDNEGFVEGYEGLVKGGLIVLERVFDKLQHISDIDYMIAKFGIHVDRGIHEADERKFDDFSFVPRLINKTNAKQYNP